MITLSFLLGSKNKNKFGEINIFRLQFPLISLWEVILNIIALKASGRDCTNNNELLHKIGVLQLYTMQLFVFTSEFLQAIRWRSKYNGCTQRIWKQSWGLSQRLRVRVPVKPFFYFLFFAFAKKQEFFAIYMFAEKKHVLMYYAHVKRLHSVKWRGLYWDTATMQELLLKTCTSSAWKKRNLEWNCHWIVYGTGLQYSLALADLTLRKLWKRSRRHMTSSSLGPVVNILAIFSCANILKKIREQKDAT